MESRRREEGNAAGGDGGRGKGRADAGMDKGEVDLGKVERMKDADERWEAKHGGNPKWGEGRARRHNVDGEGKGKGLGGRIRRVLQLRRAVT